jgi:hypothetical protein
MKKDVDVDNKLNNYLKVIGIVNSMFRPQKTEEKNNKFIQYTGPFSFVVW